MLEPNRIANNANTCTNRDLKEICVYRLLGCAHLKRNTGWAGKEILSNLDRYMCKTLYLDLAIGVRFSVAVEFVWSECEYDEATMP